MIGYKTFDSREEWLKARKTIGGSDAAAVIGKSPYMSNVELWMLKTGRAEPDPKISESPVVIYGTKAEEHLRELFALDFPEYKVEYEPNNMWTHKGLPWAHASLDFWMYDQGGRFGVGEIKTALITNSRQKEKWDDQLPQHYFIQIIHNMMVTQADFGILVVQQKWERDNDVLKVTKHFKMEADDHRRDIKYLALQEQAFWKHVEDDTCPALILPELGRR